MTVVSAWWWLPVLFGIVLIQQTLSALKWGTNRPGYYFGLRARHPRSPLFGFMWYDAGRFEGLQQVRHAAQDSDRLSTYGWHRHNADDFGQQVLYDALTDVRLTTSWLKFNYEDDSEQEAWLAVVEGQRIPNAPKIASGIIGTVWYVVSGDLTNDTVGKPVLSAHDDNLFAGKFAEGNAVQIDGVIYSSLSGDDDDVDNDKCTGADGDGDSDSCAAASSSSEEEQATPALEYSITQIMDEDNTYGSVIRPTKKGKLKAQVMNKRSYVTGIHLSEENKWRVKPIFSQLTEKQLKKLYRSSFKIVEEQYPDPQQQQNIYAQFSPNLKHTIIANATHQPNVFVVQNFLTAPFTIYYVYLPTRSVHIKSLSDLPSHLNSKEKIEAELTERVRVFEAKLQRTFNIIQRPKEDAELDQDTLPEFDADTQRKFITPGEMHLVRCALSNLVGGIGYWHGNQIWQMRPEQPPQFTADMELLSATPSRSFFPRGFLWDEGFHQLLIGMWNVDVSLEIIQSWLNTMNDLGWIPREQILGDEARSRVPQEFQVQRPYIANPPTMYLAIHALIRRYYLANDETLAKVVCDAADDVAAVEVDADGTPMNNANDDDDDACQSRLSATRGKVKNFLDNNWHLLVLNFEWYRLTQRSPHDEEASFRWAGRTPQHNLPSGLDDYPRYPNVTEHEGHVDIHSWMIRLNEIMSELGQLLGHAEQAQQWQETAVRLKQSLNAYHWHDVRHAYQDYAMVPQVLEGEDWSNASGPIHKVFADHIGYVSAFPFLLQVLDASTSMNELKHILQQLGDADGMWSDYGLRSLAKNDALYGTEEDYWRGSIWMNMNYLAVKALYDYREQYKAMEVTPETQEMITMLDKLYSELRGNLILTLYKQFMKYGFLYENYNGDDGKGQRSKPFAGWTALILNIVVEMYP